MKQKFRIFLCICLSLVLVPLSVSANAPPPAPGVYIRFEGLEDASYFAAYLSSDPEDAENALQYSDDADDSRSLPDVEYDIFRKFNAYSDPDGFVFTNKIAQCGSKQFFYFEYPPETFKILLYMPEIDGYICSEPISYDASQDYLVMAVTGWEGAFTAPENLSVQVYPSQPPPNYGRIFKNIFARIALTLVLETGIALLYKFREKKQILVIVLVNIGTQLLLNLAIWLFSSSVMYLGSLFFLEFCVFIAETALYIAFLPKVSKNDISPWKILGYTACANFISLIVGGILCIPFFDLFFPLF
ncbi:hypothetical protein H8693_05445 [Christensenellaceae bacterium NSJ-63]|uniref:Intimal thickness related receptor IRP domain-containing protein n=1 Tax=Guopingia tenuis TaxID=2763656 RepID=A0A926DIA8_9FIRM|nr:hypothetical protein [Guopingia tenuis]MBC8538376.1 hypothetical protein [Guopingia tenuis]